MELNREECKIIIEALEVCYGEGIGPDFSIFVEYIKEKYPELIEESGLLSHLVMSSEEYEKFAKEMDAKFKAIIQKFNCGVVQ